jgi:4-carboxymuconolactone decarboxylase
MEGGRLSEQGDAARAEVSGGHPADGAGRLQLLRRDQLDPAQRALHDAVAGGPRAGGPFLVTDEQGRLLGPFNALLHAPGIGDAVQRLGSALRFEGSLPARTREMVICAVAVHWDSAYEWYAHRRVALTSGVTQGELDQLRQGLVPASLTPAESAGLRLAWALLLDRSVDGGVYADALTHHAEAGVVELTVLVGYYQALGGLLAAFDVPAPEASG